MDVLPGTILHIHDLADDRLRGLLSTVQLWETILCDMVPNGGSNRYRSHFQYGGYGGRMARGWNYLVVSEDHSA